MTASAFREDNNSPNLEDEPLYLEAIKEALAGARESLKASKAINDETGVIKSTRAISDIATKLLRAGEHEKKKDEDNKFRNSVIQDIIQIFEEPILTMSDLEKRQLAVASVKEGEATRYQLLYGNDAAQKVVDELNSKALNQAIPAPETHRNASISSPDLEGYDL